MGTFCCPYTNIQATRIGLHWRFWIVHIVDINYSILLNVSIAVANLCVPAGGDFVIIRIESVLNDGSLFSLHLAWCCRLDAVKTRERLREREKEKCPKWFPVHLLNFCNGSWIFAMSVAAKRQIWNSVLHRKIFEMNDLSWQMATRAIQMRYGSHIFKIQNTKMEKPLYLNSESSAVCESVKIRKYHGIDLFAVFTFHVLKWFWANLNDGCLCINFASHSAVHCGFHR